MARDAAFTSFRPPRFPPDSTALDIEKHEEPMNLSPRLHNTCMADHGTANHTWSVLQNEDCSELREGLFFALTLQSSAKAHICFRGWTPLIDIEMEPKNYCISGSTPSAPLTSKSPDCRKSNTELGARCRLHEVISRSFAVSFSENSSVRASGFHPHSRVQGPIQGCRSQGGTNTQIQIQRDSEEEVALQRKQN